VKLDIPEQLIIALSMLLVVLWTRHWLAQHRGVDTAKSKK
jgi:hypothetical protein